MPSLDTNEPRLGAKVQLESDLLDFINNVLPRLDRRRDHWVHVTADTQLFAAGVLDSLSILHLIAAVERFTGRPVPDELVVMKHFQSVDAISTTFAHRP